MGSKPLKEIIETVVLNGEYKCMFSFGQWGKAKKNVLTTKNPPVFRLNFLKGVIHAPGQVTTPIFSANKKLRGFEHAHLKQRGEKAILSPFWARPA
jgi:hypothetical protein